MTSSSIRPIISVVVCTHNRAELLETVLNSLCRQAIDPDYYEIIVVDNGSNDRTEEVALRFALAYPNVRYYFESNLGHAVARNRGWQEAVGAYVAYIDDDAIAPGNWLSTALLLIQRDRPAMFGGPYFAYYRTLKPQWFKDEYGASMLGKSTRILGSEEFLSATNLFTRRNVLETLGGFDCAYGGEGNKLGYAEETELQQRMRRVLPAEPIRYEPALYVLHLVKPEWMSITWRARSHFIRGRYNYRAAPNEIFKRTSIATALLKAGVKCAIIGWILAYGAMFRDPSRYLYAQNYWYEQGIGHVGSLGAYYEHVRNRLNAK